MRKRVRREEHQRLLPMSILVQRILPLSFDTLAHALEVLLVCKDTLAMCETREFWAPFLNRVMGARLAWLKQEGFVALVAVLRSVYQIFPPNMSVLEAVKSKFYFDECPPGFPFAREVRVYQQRFWAISKTKYRASSFFEDERRGVPGYRCGEYREVSPSWQNRGIYLQHVCVYSAAGLLCSTFNCREYLMVYPSLVRVSGWRSSYTPRWYRMGPWQIQGPEQHVDGADRTPAFAYSGNFTLLLEDEYVMASVGEGTLVVDGQDMGIFKAFNLGETPLPDSAASTIGFESMADPNLCYIVNFNTGMLERRSHDFRLLQMARSWANGEEGGNGISPSEVEEVEEVAVQLDTSDIKAEEPLTPQSKGRRSGGGKTPRGRKGSRQRWSTRKNKRRKDDEKDKPLIISEYDYSNLGRAAYVCRRPEGVFSADEIADRFDDMGVDKVMRFDQKHRIPALVAVVVARRKGKSGEDEYRVRWQGYGEWYDTWEPERNLGDHAADAKEQFLQASVGTDDENGRE